MQRERIEDCTECSVKNSLIMI